MRAILVATLLLAVPLLALAPTADAVGTCSQLKDSFCRGYLLCVGYRWDSRGFECTGYGVPMPQPCHCPPPPEYLP